MTWGSSILGGSSHSETTTLDLIPQGSHPISSFKKNPSSFELSQSKAIRLPSILKLLLGLKTAPSNDENLSLTLNPFSSNHAHPPFLPPSTPSSSMSSPTSSFTLYQSEGSPLPSTSPTWTQPLTCAPPQSCFGSGPSSESIKSPSSDNTEIMIPSSISTSISSPFSLSPSSFKSDSFSLPALLKNEKDPSQFLTPPSHDQLLLSQVLNSSQSILDSHEIWRLFTKFSLGDRKGANSGEVGENAARLENWTWRLMHLRNKKDLESSTFLKDFKSKRLNGALNGSLTGCLSRSFHNNSDLLNSSLNSDIDQVNGLTTTTTTTTTATTTLSSEEELQGIPDLTSVDFNSILDDFIDTQTEETSRVESIAIEAHPIPIFPSPFPLISPWNVPLMSPVRPSQELDQTFQDFPHHLATSIPSFPLINPFLESQSLPHSPHSLETEGFFPFTELSPSKSDPTLTTPPQSTMDPSMMHSYSSSALLTKNFQTPPSPSPSPSTSLSSPTLPYSPIDCNASSSQTLVSYLSEFGQRSERIQREFRETSNSSGSDGGPCPNPSLSSSTVSCSNCFTTTTTLWRRNRETGLPLCNACGLFARIHKTNRPLSLTTTVIRRRVRRGKLNEMSSSVPSTTVGKDNRMKKSLSSSALISSSSSSKFKIMETISSNFKEEGLVKLEGVRISPSSLIQTDLQDLPCHQVRPPVALDWIDSRSNQPLQSPSLLLSPFPLSHSSLPPPPVSIQKTKLSFSNEPHSISTPSNHHVPTSALSSSLHSYRISNRPNHSIPTPPFTQGLVPSHPPFEYFSSGLSQPIPLHSEFKPANKRRRKSPSEEMQPIRVDTIVQGKSHHNFKSNFRGEGAKNPILWMPPRNFSKEPSSYPSAHSSHISPTNYLASSLPGTGFYSNTSTSHTSSDVHSPSFSSSSCSSSPTMTHFSNSIHSPQNLSPQILPASIETHFDMNGMYLQLQQLIGAQRKQLEILEFRKRDMEVSRLSKRTSSSNHNPNFASTLPPAHPSHPTVSSSPVVPSTTSCPLSFHFKAPPYSPTLNSSSYPSSPYPYYAPTWTPFSSPSPSYSASPTPTPSPSSSTPSLPIPSQTSGPSYFNQRGEGPSHHTHHHQHHYSSISPPRASYVKEEKVSLAEVSKIGAGGGLGGGGVGNRFESNYFESSPSDSSYHHPHHSDVMGFITATSGASGDPLGCLTENMVDDMWST